MNSNSIPTRPRRAHLSPRLNTITNSDNSEWPLQSTSTTSTSTASNNTLTGTLLPSLLETGKPTTTGRFSNLIPSIPPWRSTSTPDLTDDSDSTSSSSHSRRNWNHRSPSSSPPSSPSSPSRSIIPSTPPTTPLSTRPILTSPASWTPDFSLNLLFTSEGTLEETPPSFYPSARIFFSPQLRIESSNGIPYSSLGGMSLGVVGLIEILQNGKVKSQRILADFTTDIGAGLAIWKRDAERARRLAGIIENEEEENFLAPGSYVLPLSMRIPKSTQLPPSFECKQFRISYTMSLALFSSTTTSNGTPHRLKVYSVPFHVLPSTLPTPPPEIPVLTHTQRKGIIASLFKSTQNESYHIIVPSIPTSTYSPAAQSMIPVSIRIVDRPLEPTDLYIRVALIRRLYVRESSTNSLVEAIDDEWGINGITPNQMGLPDEMVMERWCKEEVEIVSRWTYIPYSSRPGAKATEKAEIIIQDLAIPLSGVEGKGWESGYSSSLDLEPTSLPENTHGEASWFSPAFRNRPPVAKEYSKHVHVSSKFFLSIEVGFVTPGENLKEVLEDVKIISPDFVVPEPASFTSPLGPSTSKYSGASLSNPFPPIPGSTRSHKPYSNSIPSSPNSSTVSPFNPAPKFPGKFKEILIAIEIGSVSESRLDIDESLSSRQERENREERGEDTRGEGEGSESAWRVAPPTFEEAITHAPAYVFCQ